MANGRATFQFGGVKRTLDIPLGLAIEIEDATGTAIAQMMAQGAGLRFGHACAIIGKTLEYHDIPVTDAQVLEWAEASGYEETVIAAAKILAAFFDKPKAVKGAARKGKPNGAAEAAPDVLS